MQRTLLNQNRCYRTFSFIQLSLDDQTSCCTVRVCFQFRNFSSQKDHLKQCVDTFVCMGRYRNKDRTSAPVFRNQFILGKFLFYTVDVGTWLIDFVDRNDDLCAGCFCMVDRFYSLRHYTVICCNNQDRNIGCICTTHTHGSKCFMSRCIQKCDLLSVDIYDISTDVLSNTSSFFCDHMRVTDRIQKRSLTVVNVTHNTDYRRS